ncbi:MAG: sugar transferase, partial [Terracidiphilus sp.]
MDIYKAMTLSTICLYAVGSLFHLSMIHLPFLLMFWSMSSIAVVASRWVLRYALQQIRRHGRNVRHIVIVGTNARAMEFADHLLNDAALGYHVLGFVDREWRGIRDFRATGATLLCDFDGFLAFLRENVVDEVVVVLPIKSLYPETLHIATLCEEQGITTHILSNLFELKRPRPKADPVNSDSLITLPALSPRLVEMMVKRMMDIVISLAAILILAPVLLVTAILIKLTSRGPVCFVQTRIGLNKRPIPVYKFRTMVIDAEQRQKEIEHMNEASGPVFKIKNDPRITAIGRFLRKTSIDELPQLFNVLKGDMSLVG